VKRFFKQQLSRLFDWNKYFGRGSLSEKTDSDLDPGILEVEIKVIEERSVLVGSSGKRRLLPQLSKPGDPYKATEKIGSSNESIQPDVHISSDNKPHQKRYFWLGWVGLTKNGH